MKILHYSDHPASNFIDLYNECDVLVSTGDLSQFDFFGIDSLPPENRKPAFGVYGNHDSGLYMPILGITNLHLKTTDFKGFLWGGFQGCLRYKNGNSPMFTEEEAKNFAGTFPYVDILLLHAGPKDMLDDPSDNVHVGSENIKRYVEEKRPKYIFLGHQYSNAEKTIGETKLFRTYGARIIEI